MIIQLLQMQEKRVESVRRLATILSEYVGRHLSPRRYPAHVMCAVELSPGHISRAARLPKVVGETCDLCDNGLAVVLSSVFVGGKHVMDGQLRLRVTLDLPTGPVMLHAVPVRCEDLPDDHNRYRIGLNIVEMNDADKAAYSKFLSRLSVSPSTI